MCHLSARCALKELRTGAADFSVLRTSQDGAAKKNVDCGSGRDLKSFVDNGYGFMV